MEICMIYKHLPIAFCIFAFIVNPIFIFLVFSEKSLVIGNYRCLLLFFAIFDLIYSVANVLVPLDIHSYRYCFFSITRNGWFVEHSDFNFHIMTARCSLVGASYAVLLVHFIYRYLVIQNSSLIRSKFHWYMLISSFICVLYFGVWHAICYFFGKANVEIREYIREEFQETYGNDSMNFNVIGALYSEGSDETRFRSWLAVLLTSSISTVSIIIFFLLTVTTVTQLKKMTRNASKKTSKFQVDLLRALVVQTVIPIFVSFSPCLICWYSPMFGIQLARGSDYVEVIVLGVFAFVDPVAITLCLPTFRNQIFSSCRHTTTAENYSSNRGTH